MNATSSTLKLIYTNKLNTDYFNYLIVVGKENNNYYNRPLNYFESMARTTGLFLDFFDPTTENISKLEELCNSARLIIIDDRSFGENSLAHKIKAGKIKSPELCRTPSILIPRTIKSLRIKRNSKYPYVFYDTSNTLDIITQTRLIKAELYDWSFVGSKDKYATPEEVAKALNDFEFLADLDDIHSFEGELAPANNYLRMV